MGIIKDVKYGFIEGQVRKGIENYILMESMKRGVHPSYMSLKICMTQDLKSYYQIIIAGEIVGQATLSEILKDII